jgi:hypothetical protein
LSFHTPLPTTTTPQFCFVGPLVKKEIEKGTLKLVVEATGTLELHTNTDSIDITKDYFILNLLFRIFQVGESYSTC